MILAPISLLYRVMVFLSGILSNSWTTRMTYVLLWPILRSLRHQRMTNIHKLFEPHGWTKALNADLDKRFVRYNAQFTADSLLLLRLTPQELREKVRLEGKEHLVDALKTGRGVLLVGNHIGNWLYSVAYLSVTGSLHASVSYEIPIRSLETHMQRLWKKYNIPIVSVGRGGRNAAVSTFEQNKVFLVMCDVCLRPGQGKWFNLGAAMIQADTGPAQLALSSGASILYLDNHRMPDGRYVLTISPEVHPDILAPDELALRWLEHFYQNLLIHPEQWWLLTLVPVKRGSEFPSLTVPREEEPAHDVP